VASVRSALCGDVDIATADDHALVTATEYASHCGRVLVVRNLPARCAKVMRLCDEVNELHIEDLGPPISS